MPFYLDELQQKKGVTFYRNSFFFQMERQAGLEPVTLSLGS